MFSPIRTLRVQRWEGIKHVLFLSVNTWGLQRPKKTRSSRAGQERGGLSGCAFADFAAIRALVLSPPPCNEYHARQNPEQRQYDRKKLGSAVITKPRLHLSGEATVIAVPLPWDSRGNSG